MNSPIVIQNFQKLSLAKQILFREPLEKRAFHLHCTLLGAGHEALEHDSEYFYDGLKRGSRYFCNIQFCLAGHGELEFEGQLYKLKAGDLFLTEIPHDHRYYLPQRQKECDAPGKNKIDNKPPDKSRQLGATGQHVLGQQVRHSLPQTDEVAWEFVYLTITGSEVQRIVAQLLQLNSSPVFHINLEQSQLLWEILNAQLKENIKDIFYYSGKIYCFLLSMLSRLINEARRQELPQEVLRIREFIYNHYQSNINVEGICRQSGLSSNYAMHLFKRYTGKTIHQFLEEVRLAQAQILLQFSMRRVKEVSSSVGFNDHNYFIRVFHKHFGISPGKFRRL